MYAFCMVSIKSYPVRLLFIFQRSVQICAYTIKYILYYQVLLSIPEND